MSNQLEKEFEAENNFSNQHQDDTKPHSTEDYNGSDQDSARSKETVKHDKPTEPATGSFLRMLWHAKDTMVRVETRK